MQFHENGFRPGDPRVQPAAGASAPGAEVDVLIVGCGPAGLTLAAQMAAFPDIVTAITEQKPGPLELGQADGVACRTMEMFQAFGFAHEIAEEAYWVNETTFWQPDPADPARIHRSGRIQDVEDDLSEFPHVILNQARVHDRYLDIMARSPHRTAPRYGHRLTGVEVGTGSHPVTCRFETEAGEAVIHTRYLVGCDGARSTVRRAIGRELSGDSANQAWGVMDVLVRTDFPDIRFKAVIRSAAQGNILIIPREGGYLVRLYVEMDKLGPDERVADRNITLDGLIAAAGRVLHPYGFKVMDTAWWSVYEIGQRLCDRFDDGGHGGGPGKDGTATGTATTEAKAPRVFIAGDACHTHSPKAGQGMNVSMGDTFNLGWKLAAVLRGQADPALLGTYSAERQGVAADLIAFDRHWSRRFSERPEGAAEGQAPDPAEFQDYFARHGRYTAGTAVRYAPSLIVGDDRHQALARGQVVGMRFHSAPVIRLGDAKPVQLGHAHRADGRWRLYAFGDGADPRDPASALWQLCEALATDPALPMLRCTPEGAEADAIFDLRAVLQQGHRSLDLIDLHPALRPARGRFGLADSEKVFCVDPAADIYALRGIDRARGALVVVRPDQYVAQVLPLDGTAELATFFEPFLRSKT